MASTFESRHRTVIHHFPSIILNILREGAFSHHMTIMVDVYSTFLVYQQEKHVSNYAAILYLIIKH